MADMGVFDRMWNLGRGALRVRKSGTGEILSDAELEAELADTAPSPSPSVARHKAAQPAVPEGDPAPPDEPEGPKRDANGNIIKTL